MNIIYHYTSLQGFMGIMNHSNIEPGKMAFWMSSSDYLNDTTERVHCVKVLAKLISSFDMKNETTKLVADKFNLLANSENSKIVNYLNSYVLPTSHNLVLSFSREKDSLPIWGRYAEDGNGIAIGIDEDELKKSLEEAKDIFCFDIDYTNGDQTLKYWYDLLKRNIENTQTPDDTMNDSLNMFCNIYKNVCFKYENEVRICAFKPKQMNKKLLYRISNGLIIPYQNLVLNTEIVKEIIIGPSKDPFFSRQSIIDFFFSGGRASGCSSMIQNSSIPLRK